jgi:competence protein ComEC
MKTFRYFILFFACVLIVAGASGQNPAMHVHVINVGQGSATLIEFPCGVILVDTGGESHPEFHSTEVLMMYLKSFFDERPQLKNTIHLLVISHPHIDHTRGIKSVLENYSVKNVITNGQATGSGKAQQNFLVSQISLREGTPSTKDDIGYFESLMKDIPKGGVTSKVIDPINCAEANPVIKVLGGQVATDPGWGNENGKPNFDDQNNHSVVFRVDFGQSSIIMTGDLEIPAIGSLLTYHNNASIFDSDVYLVGHHGSRNGTSEEFLKAVTPEIAVLSFGDHATNGPFSAFHHGHPNKDIIELLANHVSKTRPKKDVFVGTSSEHFEPFAISKAVYGSGWDDTLVLTATLDGKWTVGAGTDDRLDINVATKDQLMQLPNIGSTRAKAIIAFRTAQRFTTLDELAKVKGIGPATLAKLKPLLKV